MQLSGATSIDLAVPGQGPLFSNDPRYLQALRCDPRPDVVLVPLTFE